MDEKTVTSLWPRFFILIAAVVLLSLLSSFLWQGKSEKIEDNIPLIFRDGMTIAEFGKENGLPDEALKKAFLLQGEADFQKTLESLNTPRNELVDQIGKARAGRGIPIEKLGEDPAEIRPVDSVPCRRFCADAAEKNHPRSAPEALSDSRRGLRGCSRIGSRPDGNDQGRHRPFRGQRGHFPAQDGCLDGLSADGLPCQ